MPLNLITPTSSIYFDKLFHDCQSLYFSHDFLLISFGDAKYISWGIAENEKFRLEVISLADAQLGWKYEALKPEFEFCRCKILAEIWLQ